MFINKNPTEQVVQMLEHSNEVLNGIINNMPGVVFVIDEDYLIYKVNSELERISETLQKDFLGKKITDYLSEPDIFKELLKDSSHQSKELSFKFEKKSIDLLVSLNKIEISVNKDKSFFLISCKDLSQVKEILEEKARIEIEVQAASEIQNLLFPQDKFVNKDLNVASFYRTSSECGGDLMHFSTSGNDLTLWLGDVTGHGVSSAMIAFAARSAIELLEHSELQNKNLSEKMSQLNRCVHNLAESQFFMTFSIVSINSKSKIVRYCNAGHHSPIYLDQEQKDLGPVSVKRTAKFLNSPPSSPLGFSLDATFEEYELPINKGDFIFCYSDGLNEATDENGKEFGMRAVLTSLRSSLTKGYSADQMSDSLIREFSSFTRLDQLEDDVTYWLLEIT